MNYLHQLERQCSILRPLQIYSFLNLISPISIEGMLAFIKGLNLTPSCARYLGYTVKSWPSEPPNKLTRTKISSFSEETHLWDTLTSLKCSFMVSMHEVRGMSRCRPGEEKSHLVLQWRSNEQDKCAILTPSIRVLGWIEGFLDACTLSTLDRINNIRHADSLRGRKNITGRGNSLTVTWRFRYVYLQLSHNIDPLEINLEKEWPCKLHIYEGWSIQ